MNMAHNYFLFPHIINSFSFLANAQSNFEIFNVSDIHKTVSQYAALYKIWFIQNMSIYTRVITTAYDDAIRRLETIVRIHNHPTAYRQDSMHTTEIYFYNVVSMIRTLPASNL